jgi:hypothetical protein
MLTLNGLVTGIGSLPHQDADEALDLIFKYCPQLPFWPQLPKRDRREGMVIQASEGLDFLKLGSNGLGLKAADKDASLEEFYSRVIAQDTDYFSISPEYGLGLHRFYERLEKTGAGAEVRFLKLQLCGPFSFAAAIQDEKGHTLLNDPAMLQAVIKGLGLKALWQARLFKKFGRRIIFFFDEPYLGCFGSAYSPLDRQQVVEGLSELAQALKAEDVLVGLHCCGNTDWSIVTDTLGIDIISFDAFAYLERLLLYADSLKAFLSRGGILCWGIVPTGGSSGSESAEFLKDKIQRGIEGLARKGLDRELLFRQMLLSPSCGLGTLDKTRAEQIFSLLAVIASLVK